MTEQEIKVVGMIVIEELEKRGLNSFTTTASIAYAAPITATIFSQGDRDKFLAKLSQQDSGLTPTEPDTKEPVVGSNGIINGEYKE